MRVQREQQALIASATAEAFHHREQLGESEAEAAVVLRNRHPEHAELGAPPPGVAIEVRLAIPFHHVRRERAASERDCRILKFLLFL